MSQEPLFPRNCNDLGGVRAPYCYIAAWFLWCPLIATVAMLLSPVSTVVSYASSGVFAIAWGFWIFRGWRNETREDKDT